MPGLPAAEGRAPEGRNEDQEGMGPCDRLKMAFLGETAFQREKTSEVEAAGFDRLPTAREERARRRVPDLWKEQKALKEESSRALPGRNRPGRL
jgi:hypothetical protein